MGKVDPGLTQGFSETVTGFMDSVSKLLVYAGAGALVAGAAFLIYTIVVGNGASPDTAAQAQRNIELFGKVALIGGLSGALGLTWIMWGEETLGAILVLVGSAFYFAPYYLPGLMEMQVVTEVARKGLDAVGAAGAPIGAIGLCVIVIDLIGRVRTRSQEGARAEQLKFGKGMKEERDIRNVFLGKCWQLPYCRKFVRERCPIYHARRTCWQERVGCMCEESVIQNAMEGKVIPSDVVAAAKFIPRNSKLTPGQKAERCRQCVIYNEHQKHKYKLALPATAVVLVLVFFALHTPLKDWVQGLLTHADTQVSKATFNGKDISEVTSTASGVIPYAEIVLIAGFLIIFAYCVRVLEYLFFKLKV